MVRRLWLNKNILIIMAVFLALMFFFVSDARAESAEVSSPDELAACLEEASVNEIVFVQDIDCSGNGIINLGKKIDLNGNKWTVDTLILKSGAEIMRGSGKVIGTVLKEQTIAINGMTEEETIRSITFSDGSHDDSLTSPILTQSGEGFSLTLNVFMVENSQGERNPLAVKSMETQSGHVYRMSASGGGQKLSRVYTISYYYLDKKTKEYKQIESPEITLKDYTSDDGNLQLPADPGSGVTPEKGYSFLGWSETKDPKAIVKQIKTGTSGNLIFYAVWTKDQGNGFGGGRSGFSAGSISSMLSSGDATMEATSETAAAAQQSNSAGLNGTGSSRRRISTGKSKTIVNFNDDTSDEMDIEGKLNADVKADDTDRFLILGIGLVAIAAIGLIGLIRKKKP